MSTSTETPRSESEWCEHFHYMDRKFGTDVRSPLHHDNCCNVAGHSIPGVIRYYAERRHAGR